MKDGALYVKIVEMQQDGKALPPPSMGKNVAAKLLETALP